LKKMISLKRIVLVGLGASLLLSGCGPQDTSQTTSNPPAASAEEQHAHGQLGAHGGHLIELGDAYHAELVGDHEAGTVTVYLLDDQATPLDNVDAAELTLSMFRNGEFVDYSLSAGDRPCVFTLVDDQLCRAFDHDDEVRARIKIMLDGQELVGKLEQEPHEH
jgi:hypothetical protein